MAELSSFHPALFYQRVTPSDNRKIRKSSADLRAEHCTIWSYQPNFHKNLTMKILTLQCIPCSARRMPRTKFVTSLMHSCFENCWFSSAKLTRETSSKQAPVLELR